MAKRSLVDASAADVGREVARMLVAKAREAKEETMTNETMTHVECALRVARVLDKTLLFTSYPAPVVWQVRMGDFEGTGPSPDAACAVLLGELREHARATLDAAGKGA
jgi:hypothetical protein